MLGIYSYIPETNHVSRIYSITAVLYLQFVLHVMLFCTFTLALSVVCVQSPILQCFVFDFVLAWYVAQVLSQ